MTAFSFFGDIPTAYLVFLFGLAMVCGFAADWVFGKHAFGLFANVAVFFAGACVAFELAGMAGIRLWDEALVTIAVAVAGGVGMFMTLGMAKNRLLP